MVFGVVFQVLMKKRNSCKVIEQNFISSCMCCIKCEGISSFGREQQTGIVPCLQDLPCMRDTRILMGKCATSFLVKQRIHKFSVYRIMQSTGLFIGCLRLVKFLFQTLFNFFFSSEFVTNVTPSSTLVVNGRLQQKVIIAVYKIKNLQPSYTQLANRMCE